MNTPLAQTLSLPGRCHCGAVTITLQHAPEKATSCNCTLCHRLGAVSVYYPFNSVVITGHPEHTAGYIQGDRTLRTVHCRTCGCATHWEPLDQPPDARAGINLRLFDKRWFEAIPVRRFDGADTWTFLD